MDSLTSIRIFNLHRLLPSAVPFMQRLPIGQILSFRGGDPTPTLFNGDVGNFQKIIPGGCRLFAFNGEGDLFGLGENYFAQLGTHNIINQQHGFTKIPGIKYQTIKSVGCGFQHTLIVTGKILNIFRQQNKNIEDAVYGCGKASDYQIQPLKYRGTKQIAQKIQVPELMLKGQKVRKAAGGLKFSLIWTQPDRLYAVGDNRFGQCGQNYLQFPQVTELTPIHFDLQAQQHLIDIQCGFCHSLVLTNQRVYFFGSIEQGQNPFSSFNDNICALTPLPIPEPVSIFANFDRSAVVSAQGKVFLFGGLDYSYCGGQKGALQVVQGVGPWSQVGLGFAHTLLYP